jgi:type IV pilus assembly protein PilN
MIRINLLAIEREKPKRRSAVAFDIGQKVTLVCSLILVVAVLGIAWWWWALNSEQARLATETTNAEHEAARLKSILAQVATFDKQKQQLQERVALIEELRKGQGAAVHMVDELSKAVPDMLWLTDMKQDGGELTIDGRCTSLTALSDFVANMEHSTYFRKPVEILDSQVDTTGAPAGTELIKFSLKATYALPGTEPVPASGKSGPARH